uniref:Uncharacterized protein n=1 Tax=Anopheles farauti TaxID=69004 RepID=A0A182QU45_9DIPT
MNVILVGTHNGWLEKYKRVTESLGFFTQLGALFLICHHASCLANERNEDAINYRIYLLQDQMKIAPFDLFIFNMKYFFGVCLTLKYMEEY